MKLWLEWYKVVRCFQGDCSRTTAYIHLVLILLGFTRSGETEGVTGLIRRGGLRPLLYKRLLHFFNASPALALDRLTRTWVRVVPQFFSLRIVKGRWVAVVDGIKPPKEGRKMPGVKSLHQESSNNSKPPYIMGHSLQALALLVVGPLGEVAALLLLSRIHEGLRASPRDRSTLMDRLVEMVAGVDQWLALSLYMVGDAFYASGDLMSRLQERGHHLITRAKANYTAYRPAEVPERRGRGRPPKYGEKIKLAEWFRLGRDFQKAPSPLRGEDRVEIEYRSECRLWKPLKDLIQIVWVKHPLKGHLILMCTDLTLNPLQVIELYGYRFRIEWAFRTAVQAVGVYAYHFWMKAMKAIKRRDGDQYLHRKNPKYREQVRRKVEAYHRYIQCGIIAQGLLTYLSLYFRDEVWSQFRSWFRTQKRHQAPSERVVSMSMRFSLLEFWRLSPADHPLRKILEENVDPEQMPDWQSVA